MGGGNNMGNALIFDWLDLRAIAPEMLLALSGLVLLMGVAFGARKNTVHALAVLVLLYAAGVCSLVTPVNTSPFHGLLHLSDFTQYGKALLLLSSALVLMQARPWLLSHPDAPNEFVVLSLFSALGLMLLISASSFLMLYMSLELSSLALYVLAAIRRDDGQSSEAGIKYFVLGSLSSCLMLFGISLIYGTTGSVDYAAVGHLLEALKPGQGTVPSEQLAFLLGLVLVLVGLFFKISAVPFHMWTPDVYSGTPTVVTSLFAAAPKIAAVLALTTLLAGPFAAAPGFWQGIVVLVAVGSMLVGAWGAITQTQLKRLLAYSSIGHVGFMLVGLAAGGQAAISSVFIYLVIYAASNIGAFGVVLLLTRREEPVEHTAELAGLSRTHPLMAFAMASFLLSMAGIPPLAGFFGKFYVFLAAIQSGMIGLAVIGVLASVVSCFYYLKIIKIMYFDEPSAAFDVGLPLLSRFVVLVCLIVTLFFLLLPAPLLSVAHRAALAFAS